MKINIKQTIKPRLRLMDDNLRLCFSLFIFFFSSLSFYAFMYYSRELSRVLVTTPQYQLWRLSEEEVSFYNLFFACIATLFAQVLALNFYLDKPKTIGERKYWRRRSIINDNRALFHYFLFWFFKLAFLYFCFFGLNSNAGFQAFSFYPDYQHLFILIVVVLFLQSWTTIRLTFKNTLKIMFFTAILISLFAFGLSKVNFIDYVALNENILQKCLKCKYSLQLPRTNYFNSKTINSSKKEVYILLDKHSKPIIITNNQILTLLELSEKIKKEKKILEEYERNYFSISFFVDERVEMYFIYQMENMLKDNEIGRIEYAVLPEKGDSLQQQNAPAISLRLPPKHTTTPLSIQNLSSKEQVFQVENIGFNSYLYDGKKMDISLLEETIALQLDDQKDYTLRINMNNKNSFGDYIKMIMLHRKVILKKREAYCLKKFKKRLEEASYEEIDELQDKYPWIFFYTIEEIWQ